MIYNSDLKPIQSFAFYDGKEKRMKMIQQIHYALSDGSFVLVWNKDGAKYIRIVPDYLYWGNQELGIIKTSKIVTNGDWSLNEVIIEELL